MENRADRPSRSGFTLIELLVALVISGILAGVIYEILERQGRFARLQAAREEAQQNARVALAIIASGLRGVGNQGIYAGDAESISFYTPWAWGMVCGYLDQDLVVLFPTAALETAVNEPDDDSHVNLATPPSTAGVTKWAFMEVKDVTSTEANLSEANDLCMTSLNPIPAVTATSSGTSRVRVYADSSELLPTELTTEDYVYLYRDVTYDVNTSNVPGHWIRRNSDPMAGPVPAKGGLVFSYYEYDGSTEPFNEITDDVIGSGKLDDVAMIGIRVVAQSREEFNGVPQKDTAFTEVFLRNRN